MLKLVPFSWKQATQRPMFMSIANSMTRGIAEVSLEMLLSKKRSEPGKQAPGQCFRAHSIAKFHFRQ
jgi:hypothetical protein